MRLIAPNAFLLLLQGCDDLCGSEAFVIQEQSEILSSARLVRASCGATTGYSYKITGKQREADQPFKLVEFVSVRDGEWPTYPEDIASVGDIDEDTIGVVIHGDYEVTWMNPDYDIQVERGFTPAP